jgi:methylenetetrahydrofolate dehydrogenase (NADP+) / methenyltetrahydrofolate cyclohydrolase
LTKIIEGIPYAVKIKEAIKKECLDLNIKPGLAVILLGDDPGSLSYVKNKIKACNELGFYSKNINLPSDIKEQDLINMIDLLSKDNSINAILVQLPLPKHIDENKIIEKIPVNKDVDCFTNYNLGALFSKKDANFYDIILPCTPAGVIYLLEQLKLDLNGKNIAVIGRSNIVGKPLSLMLSLKNATVTLCHSKTKNLELVLSDKDIVISAIGKANFIKKEMIKKEAVLIDVGTSLNSEGKLSGDFDFDNLINWASIITKVPKGIGPLTIAMLMKNTLYLAKKQNNK